MKTTFCAQSAYYFVTFWVLFMASDLAAQQLDLGALSLRASGYLGNSEETYKKHPCRFVAKPLEKNFLGRLEQLYELLVLEKDGRSIMRRQLVRLNPKTRVLSPDTCNRRTKECTWDVLVTEMETQNKESRDIEVLSLQVEAAFDSPEEMYDVRLYKQGSATGKKRLHWDCSIPTPRNPSLPDN